MTVLAADYLDNYINLCTKKRTFLIKSIQQSLEESVERGSIPDTFTLNGNSKELRNNRINDDYLDLLLTPMRGTGFLKTLDLSYNQLTDRGAKLLAAFLKDDVQMETLNLQSNDIGVEGAGAIAKALHINDKLLSLNLSDNPIGDDGGMHFATMLQINSSLTSLSLAGTSLGSTSLISFATVLRNNTTLAKINLSNNMSHSSTLTQSQANDVMMHICRTLCLNYTLREVGLAKMGITDWSAVDFLAKAVRTNLRITHIDLS
ncbi:hypothetical protein HK104_006965, partial [Borealophlyctis nickersoniae]